MNQTRLLLSAPLLLSLSLAGCGDASPAADESGTSDATTQADTSTDSQADAESDAEATGEATGDGDGDGDTGVNTDDFVKWEVRMPDFSPLPFLPTYYSCYSQTIEVDSPIQLVGFEPVVNDPHVHHYVVQLLDTPTTDNPADPCLQEPWDNMVWGWAPGGEPLYLPEDVGVLAGETGTVTVRFQVHYDNPLGDSFTDNGGFDVYYLDENLRPNNAGIATFGDIDGINVPAGEIGEHVASCPESYTSANFPEDMHVIGSWLHAHEFGTKLWGVITPGDGGDPYELGREDPYNFDQQTFKTMEDVTLHPGDRVDTHCIYDNTEGTGPLVGGPETQNEMCINFLMYWPKVAGLDECGAL